MSTHIELLFTLLSLLAGVLYAWIAVQGWQPRRLLPSCLRARPRGAVERQLERSAGLSFGITEEETQRTAP